MFTHKTAIALLLVLLLFALGPVAADGTLGEESALGVAQRGELGEPAGPPRTGEELDREADALEGEMRCPVCQGLSIAASPSPMARDMRGEVRTLLGQGYSPEQVMGYFESTYGEFVRLEPKPEGFNLVVWIAPFAVVVLGLLLVIAQLRRSRPAADLDDPELEAFQERVRREVSS